MTEHDETPEDEVEAHGMKEAAAGLSAAAMLAAGAGTAAAATPDAHAAAKPAKADPTLKMEKADPTLKMEKKSVDFLKIGAKTQRATSRFWNWRKTSE